MQRLFHIVFSLLMAAICAPVVAGPLDDAVDVRILPGWRGADGTHVAAIEVTLSEGWKTYWRAPGDAGIPPRFDWRGSRNLSGVEINWPTPRVMDQGGVRTIGYARRLILPLRVEPTNADAPVRLKAALEIGVCKDVCVPYSVRVQQDLPQSGGTRDSGIVAALADRPFSAQEAGVGRVGCQITPQAGETQLRVEIDLPDTGGQEVVIVETDNPQIWVAQPETRRSGNRLIAETALFHVEGRAFAVNRSGLRITVLGASHAVDIQGCSAG